MTTLIEEMKKFFIKEKAHHRVRTPLENKYALAYKFSAEKISDMERTARRFEYVVKNEKPYLFKNERIAFVRTVSGIPSIYTKEEIKGLKEKYWLHEAGEVSNINVDYTKLLNTGFKNKIKELEDHIKNNEKNGDLKAAEYNKIQLRMINAVSELAEKYRELAIKEGNEVVAETLSNVPENPPHNFIEALQMFRIIHYAMWCSGSYHNTIGRFDQYMYPYLKKDIETGQIDYDGALELLEEFFLTFNRDSDLYQGMQQGDNGQSIVLGGLNPDGTDSYNMLSELCLKASLELKLIDPKVNLRVHKNTPHEIYVLGSQLTKQGLGFPQYSNDDVVIPGLIELGYEPKDAYNYALAACWEFIIPGNAMDIPNIAAVSFAEAVEEAAVNMLKKCETYEKFEKEVYKNIKKQADKICKDIKNLYIFPSPFLSLMMDGCTENAKDISLGCKYNNYGFHGTGIATAIDSLTAIKKYVFEEESISRFEFINALKNDFNGYEMFCSKLRYDTPKFGNDIDEVDEIACKVLEKYSNILKGRKNERGGILRAGTGSAMYYIWHSKDMLASPDGRHKGEGIAANYSPSLFSRCKGPVSIIKSFSKPPLKKVINGGPLTLELHDSVFRTEDSIKKVAYLVQSFMDLGGHQLQLNAVNREQMIDAQKHPENYKNLIVRVWGWSGYFVELDKEYQDHIIKRMELII